MGAFYRIKTRHGTWLGVDPKTCLVVARDLGSEGAESHLLTVYVSLLRQTACFLIAESAGVHHLEMHHELDGDGVLPLGLLRHPPADFAFLYHPNTGKWVRADPIQCGNEFGVISPDSKSIGESERFTFVPTRDESVSQGTADMARRLENIIAAPLTCDTILSLSPEDAPALDAVARLAPQWQLDALAQSLLNSPRARSKLAELLPRDLWATVGLPSLADWLAGRTVKDGLPEAWHMTLGTETDELGHRGFKGDYVSFPRAVTALARQSVEPRRNVCIVASARNEGLYLLDWIAYHRAIGVEDFFIYTNDNDDGSDDLLAALARAHVIHWIDNKVVHGQVRPQFKAYGHAFSIRPDVLDFRWALAIDLDEYMVLNPEAFTNIREYLVWQETDAVDAIGLNWIWYGSCGATRWVDEFIVRRFPNPTETPRRTIKSLFRPRQFIHSSAHHPMRFLRRHYVFKNASGGMHIADPITGLPEGQSAVVGFAWINHYYYKSTEEFLLKKSRNTGDRPTVTGATNALLKSHDVYEFGGQFLRVLPPNADPEAAAPTFDAELAHLKNLPGVTSALARVQQISSARMRDLVPLFATAPAIKEVGAAGEALIDTLRIDSWPHATPDAAATGGALYGPDVMAPPNDVLAPVKTHWGTILFADVATGSLRHGKPDTVPRNVVLAAQDGVAYLLHLASDDRRYTVCPLPPSMRALSAQDPTKPRTWLRAFRLVPSAGQTKSALFSLRNFGLFLCAETNGDVTLSRGAAGPWECFSLADQNL